MLELTRRCDMTCSHCLRGDAQGVDMSEHTLITALRLFEGVTSEIGIGGGEPTLKPALLSRLRHSIIWTGIFPDTITLVTNGKRLVKEIANVEYDDYDEYGDMIAGPANDAIRELSWNADIEISVSVDRWHGTEATQRLNTIESSFEYFPKVRVSSQGPVSPSNLIGIGRAKGYRALEVYLAEECHDIGSYQMMYVTVKGDIYISCDMSYKMYDSLTRSKICLGNVHTTDFESIEKNFRELSSFGTVELWEDMTVEEVDSQFVIP